MGKPHQKATKLQALINRLKVAACEMRSQELFYRAEADRLEECIRLLSTSVEVQRGIDGMIIVGTPVGGKRK